MIEQYVHKGDKVMVEGMLKTRKSVDQSGTERDTTEIVLSGFSGQLIMPGSPRGTSRDCGRPAPARQRETAGNMGGYTPGAGADLNDEFPFAPSVD